MPMHDDNTPFSDACQPANLMAGYKKSFKKHSVCTFSGIQLHRN